MPKKPVQRKESPRWKWYPEKGINYSTLSKWRKCPERFRLYKEKVQDSDDTFNAKMIFGSLFHAHLEKDADQLEEIINKALDEHMEAVESIHEVNFYAEHTAKIWAKHGSKYQEVQRELQFYFPYDLDGQLIWLHGFIDFIEKIPGKKLIRIGENKTRGRFRPDLGIQLKMNAQSMLYHVAIRHIREWERVPDWMEKFWGYEPPHKNCYLPCRGTSYITLLRPGGHSRSPRKKKSETKGQLMARTVAWYEDNFKEQWEHLRVPINDKMIDEFEQRWLKPTLRQFIQWYQLYKHCENVWDNPLHWQAPFGEWDGVAMGYNGDYFSYLTGGR